MYAHTTETEFNREDLFLSKQQRESKRLCEFILNQEPVLTEYSAMTGFLTVTAPLWEMLSAVWDITPSGS